MRMNPMTVLLSAAVVVAGLVLFVVLREERQAPDERQEVVVSRNGRAGEGRVAAGRVETRIGGQGRRTSPPAAKSTLETGRKQPEDPSDKVENDKLDAELQKVIAELESAAKGGDFKRVESIVARLKKMLAGLGERIDGTADLASLTRGIKRKILEALSSGGAGAVPEVLDFVLDADPEVATAAVDQLMMSLRDPALGDRGRAEIVVASASTLTDNRTLDLLMTEVYNMRHSVAAETMANIYQKGSPAAREKVIATMQTYTADQTVDSPEALDAWLQSNPDNSFDGLMYGPMKNLMKVK